MNTSSLNKHSMIVAALCLVFAFISPSLYAGEITSRTRINTNSQSNKTTTRAVSPRWKPTSQNSTTSSRYTNQNKRSQPLYTAQDREECEQRGGKIIISYVTTTFKRARVWSCRVQQIKGHAKTSKTNHSASTSKKAD